jgi:hypothetical protein
MLASHSFIARSTSQVISGGAFTSQSKLTIFSGRKHYAEKVEFYRHVNVQVETQNV